MNRWLCIGTVILGWSAVHSIASLAEDTTSVTVAFSLVQPNYRQLYSAEELKDLEDAVAAQIAQSLQSRIRVVHFTSEKGSPYTLGFRLSDIGDIGAKDETVFHIMLTGQGIKYKGTPYWQFRTRSHFTDGVVPVETFRREIKDTIDRLAPYDDLVSTWLVQVPVAKTSIPYKNPLGWILPHTRREMCVEFDTKFVIHSRLPVGNQKLLRKLVATAVTDFEPPDQTLARHREQIFAELRENDQEDRVWLKEFKNANVEEIGVDGVYLTRYLSSGSCAGPIDPRNNHF